MEGKQTICGVSVDGFETFSIETLEQSEAEKSRLRTINLIDLDMVGRWLCSNAASDQFSATLRLVNQRIVMARKTVEQNAYHSTHYACENQSF